MSAVIGKIGKGSLKERISTEERKPCAVRRNVVMGGAPVAG